MIARYYPAEYKSYEKQKNISYNSLSSFWNGRIDIFTYDERHFIGFIISEGEVTETIQYGNQFSENSRIQSDCRTIFWEVVWTTSSPGDKEEDTYGYGSTFHSIFIAETTCSGSGGYTPEGSIIYGDRNETYPYRNDSDSSCGSCNYDPPTIPRPKRNLRIQIDPSFGDNKYLSCILEKLKLTQFVEDLALFDGTVANGRNVILKVGEVPKRPGYMSAANAETNDDLGPYSIQITINKDRLDLSSLELARIILHEMIHAELFVANFHKGGSPIDGNFEANFNTYIEKYFREGNAGIHHNYMAENIVNKMATALSSIHTSLGKQKFIDHPETKKVFPNGLSSDFYKGLAWKGLDSTHKWIYNLPERTDFENFQKLADAALNNDCNTN